MSKIELPLNEDGRVDIGLIETLTNGLIEITGGCETFDLYDILEAIEAHTIERCADVVFQSGLEGKCPGDIRCDVQDLTRSLKTGEE